MFGVHKWRSETATVRFVENTQELVAIQLGTLAVLANIFEIPKYLELLHYSPGMLYPSKNKPRETCKLLLLQLIQCSVGLEGITCLQIVYKLRSVLGIELWVQPLVSDVSDFLELKCPP